MDTLAALASVSQAAQLPPTSGNTTTLVLGLVAFSLLFLVVGAWLVRIVGRFRSVLRFRRPSSLSQPERPRVD